MLILWQWGIARYAQLVPIRLVTDPRHAHHAHQDHTKIRKDKQSAYHALVITTRMDMVLLHVLIATKDSMPMLNSEQLLAILAHRGHTGTTTRISVCRASPARLPLARHKKIATIAWAGNTLLGAE